MEPRIQHHSYRSASTAIKWLRLRLTFSRSSSESGMTKWCLFLGAESGTGSSPLKSGALSGEVSGMLPGFGMLRQTEKWMYLHSVTWLSFELLFKNHSRGSYAHWYKKLDNIETTILLEWYFTINTSRALREPLWPRQFIQPARLNHYIFGIWLHRNIVFSTTECMRDVRPVIMHRPEWLDQHPAQ